MGVSWLPLLCSGNKCFQRAVVTEDEKEDEHAEDVDLNLGMDGDGSDN